MKLEEFFQKAANGSFTYDEFVKAMTENNVNFTDLSEGNYVSRSKYDDEISKRDTRINTLDDTIKTRDTDLANLQKTLNDAGDIDALKNASKDLDALQKKYDKDTKAYQAQLQKQAYEFAVKDFANSKKFTSSAAKRDFISTMLSKNLTMENDTIIGATDFMEAYSKDNADAFVSEEPVIPEQPAVPNPSFVSPTNPVADTPDDFTGGFADAFHFTPIHPFTDK